MIPNAIAFEYYASYNLTMRYVFTCNTSCTIDVKTYTGTASELFRITDGLSLTNYRMTYDGGVQTITLTLAKRTVWYLKNINATKLNGLVITISTKPYAYPEPQTSLSLYFLPMTASFSAERADVKYVGNFNISMNRKEFYANGSVALTVTITRELYEGFDTSTGYLTITFSNDMIKEMMTLIHTLPSMTVTSMKVIVVNGVSNVIDALKRSIIPVFDELIKTIMHLVFPAKPKNVPYPVFGTWAMGVRDGKFSLEAPILIVTLSGPSDLDGVYVTYLYHTICYYHYFALSADDVKALRESGKGLTVSGYYGSTEFVLDNRDLNLPGGIIVNVTSEGRGVTSSKNSTVLPSLKDPFVTVVAGTWEVLFVSPSKVETYFNPTNATVTFMDVSNEVEAVKGSKVRTFDSVRVRGDRWSLIIWCNKININVMDKVEVVLLSRSGGVTRVEVPLLVQ